MLFKIFLSPSLVVLWILRSKIGTMQLAVRDIVALMILVLCREMVILHLIRFIISDVFLLIVESFVLHEVSVSCTLSDLLPLSPDLFVLNLRETSFDGSNKFLLLVALGQLQSFLDDEVTVVVRDQGCQTRRVNHFDDEIGSCSIITVF